MGGAPWLEWLSDLLAILTTAGLALPWISAGCVSGGDVESYLRPASTRLFEGWNAHEMSGGEGGRRSMILAPVARGGGL